MDLEYTIRIGGEDIPVEVEHIDRSLWRATALYQGTRYDAAGNGFQGV
jgi:hypothetical protein